ncbi:MAG: Calx-beta domain-containing protein, partial [Desulfobacteraceae bacterium]
MGPHNRHHKEERESGFPRMKIEKFRILAIFVAAVAIICLSAQPAFAVMNAVDDTGITDADSVLNVTFFLNGVLINDSGNGLLQVISNDPLSAEAASVTVNADGTYTYDPTGSASLQSLAQGETTNDTFDYMAQDGDPSTDTATVTIEVTGVNDEPTGLSLDSTNVDENSAAGTVIGNFSTIDVDTSDTHSYSLVAGPGDDDNASFSIPGAGNQLQTNAVFDYETKNSYNIRVQTDDGNGGTFQEQFTITVNDINDAPVVNDQSFNVDENSVNGTVVGTVAASDEDVPSQTLTYTVMGGTGQTAFNLNAGTGEITVADSNQLDFETTPSFTLDVQLTDDGLPNVSDTATITITLNDINEVPVADFSGLPLTIVEGNSVNFTDLSTDPENDLVGWSWDFDNNGTEDSTLQNPSYVYNVPGIYSVELTVADGGGLPDAETKANYITVQGKPIISVNPATLTPVVVAGNNASDQTFDLTNDNGAAINPAHLNYSISEDSGGWIASVTPNAGTLASGASATLTVTYNTAALTPGNYSATITISDVNGDAAPATVTVNLTTQAVLTINDISVNEGDGVAQFTVSLSAASSGDVTVQYDTADDTALQPGDYSQTSGVLTITAGNVSGTIDVPLSDDDLVENQEGFFVNLSSPNANATIGDNQGVGTIQDDDTYDLLIQSVTPFPATEGTDNTVTFTLALTNVDPAYGILGPITVDYETIDNNATGGLDYVSVSPAATLTFNNAIETVDVTINPDALVENDETFDFTLSNFAGPQAGSITNGSETATIQDDADTYDVSIQSVAPSPAEEGTDNTVTFTLGLANVDPTHGVVGTVQVDYATGGGTATPDSDYLSASG